jgi:hypothetical protein
MKMETKANFDGIVALDMQVLSKLRASKHRYVRVHSFTHDKRMDYMEPYYFVLVPFEDLQDDPEHKGIYEAVDSELLTLWASNPNDGAKVFVTAY